MPKSYFWNFLCCIQIQYDFLLLLFLRDLAVCIKTKTFFYVLTKTGYFNTGFVSLQYKNKNQYWSKCSKIFAENHRFFEINFEDFFSLFFLGWAQPGPCGWAGPSRPQPGQWPKPVTRLPFKRKACVNCTARM
jgi:hypothetical protein